MSAPFELIDTRAVPALRLQVQRYRHTATGARHLHLAADDDNNAFAVAFLTVPQDSTGVAHILEHTVLCGSERFPVRDPFFNMLKRSLNTFMNAFTASDWTAYPFASQNRKDFDNLLQVYLDAVFFPRLDPLDFAQEGHRLELDEDDAAGLVVKGVVFNEMKGAMSAPVSQVHQSLQAHLFPTITYHHNSGGDPACIPDLTHAALRAFHARHYHPSNAVFLTYGSFPVAEHHARIHELALSRFGHKDIGLRVPDEQRYVQPLQVDEHYAADAGEADPGACHVVLGWLLGNSLDPATNLQAHLLNGVLLEHAGSPLRAALETSGLGAAPSELCGLDDSTRESTFSAGLEGARAEDAGAIEALIMDTLRSVAEQGVDQAEVDAVLHQLELAQREVGGDHFPYGLSLLLKTLGPALHGGDPVAALDLEDELGRLATAAREPGFVAALVRRLLLDNPHRVRLTMRPSATLSAERETHLRERLRTLRAGLGEEARRHLAEQSAALLALQDAEPDVEVLPKVGIEDVPAELRVPTGRANIVGGTRCCWYEAGTNGLVYLRLVAPLGALPAEHLAVLPLLCDVLTEVGCANRDYRRNQSLQAATVGGLDASISMRAGLHDSARAEAWFVLAGKALQRNQEGLAQLLCESLARPRFDEHERLRELVAQLRAQDEARVTDIGHSLALLAANDGLTPVGTLNEQWSGLSALAALKQLDRSLDEPAQIAALAARLQAAAAALAQTDHQLVVVAEASAHDELGETLAQALPLLPAATGPSDALLSASAGGGAGVAWLVNAQVNFCAQVYRAAPQGHADAAALFVLAGLMRNDFLHRELREKGGAYGGGASYDGSTGTFGFYSYRDPRLSATLRDFERAIDWAHDAAAQRSAREQAILGVIGAIDRPGSPAGEALTAFMGALHGRSAEQRRALRQRILEVDTEALRGALERHLRPGTGTTAIVTSRRGLESDPQAPALRLCEL